MNAAEILDRLRAVGVEVRAEGGALLCRPALAVIEELRREALAHKAGLLALLAEQAARTPGTVCPGCGRADYLPLGQGWRRCWPCAHRWGPVGTPDPGAPADLDRTAWLLGLDGRPGRPLGG